jgi:serine/threonine protein kinase
LRAKLEDKYFLQKVKLGQGSFGTVWRAVDKQNDRVVAVKQLDKATMPKRQVSRKDIEREVELMKAVKHENITQLFDTFEDDKSIFLALEYCDGGDFGDKVKERGMSLREEEAADWMAQICAAIAALHTKGIIHRDIKPDNFMVSVNTVKLSDFGLACFLPRGKLLTDKCGTPAFMAPEQVQLPSKSRGYSFPCDMWAAGISMYMLMFGGRHPFLTRSNQLDEGMLIAGKMDFREGVSASSGAGGFLDGLLGGAPRGNLRFSEKARQVCTSMVQPNAASRMTAEDSLKNPWLRRMRRDSKSQPPAEAPASVQQMRPSVSGPPNGGYPQQAKVSSQAMAQAAAASAQSRQEYEEAQRRIRSLESKNVALQNALITAKSSRPGPLRVGLRCRYYSPTYGWMTGMVQGMNDQDGTYNLDCRQHAAPDKISPPDKPTCNDDIWPPGTWVCYESSSMGTYLPGVITGWNQNDCTYNLDVREHAAMDKIRARIGDPPPLDDHGYQRPDGMRTEKNQQPGENDYLQQAVTIGPDGTHSANTQAWAHTGRASQPARPPDGAKCMLLEQLKGYPEFLPAMIEGFNQADGTYSLLVDPHNSRRRQQAQPEAMRAPKDEADAWPGGVQVFYESASLGSWLPAVIVGFNAANGAYNLDVRENAAPERVRPR